jgi:hypothetical protein
MAIEFRCSSCGRLLRVGDEAAGKMAQCPECGAQSTIPFPVAAGAEGHGWDQAGPERPSLSQGMPGPGPAPFSPAHAIAAARVSGPATALIVTAAIGIAMSFATLTGNSPPMPIDKKAVPPEFHEAVRAGQAGGAMLGIGIEILIVIGAMKMKRLESHSFAMAAAILSLIPCASPCCCLQMPFAIWALLVLGDPMVKAAFRS